MASGERAGIRGLAPLLDAPDVERSVAFYRDRLGCTVREDHRADDGVLNYAWLERGKAALMVEHSNDARHADPVRAHWDTNLYIYVDDAAAARAEFAARGVEVSDLVDKWCGMREFEVRDVDGCTLKFGESTMAEWKFDWGNVGRARDGGSH